MKLTFNKCNWSGETTTINVNQTKRTFMHYEDRVTLVPNDKEGTSFNAIVEGFQDPVALVVSFKDDGKTYWTAYDLTNDSLNRTDANMYAAVSKVLHNII